MLLFVRLLRRFHSRRGAVALEALLCTAFMLGVFYTMWGAALMIFNQTQLNTASQFASQGAAVIYNRDAYRGQGTPPGGNCPSPPAQGYACEYAEQAAATLASDNAQGMAPDQYNTSTPSITGVSVDIECASFNSGSSTPWSTSNCGAGSGLDSASDNVTRVAVQAQSSAKFWLLAPLSDSSTPRANPHVGDNAPIPISNATSSEQLCLGQQPGGGNLNSCAVGYSFAPGASENGFTP